MPILLQGSMWHTQKRTDQDILRQQRQKAVLDSREDMPTTAFHCFAVHRFRSGYDLVTMTLVKMFRIRKIQFTL
jgi:hypothetical protein